MDQQIPAIIYPSHTTNGYGAIWSLGLAGIPVIALSPRKNLHFGSRFVEESHVTPDAASDTEHFVDFLVELGKQRNAKTVLYMMEDVYAFIASAYRDRLEPYYLYPYLTWEQLNATLSKRAMYEAAIVAGVQLPDTWFPEDQSWAEQNAKSIRYPVIIKPLVSRFSFKNRTISQVVAFPAKYGKAIEVHSADELCEFLPQVLKEGFSVCVQERIECRIDDLWSHFFYCGDRGEILTDFTGRKLHQEPPDFGTGVVCKAEVNPHIVEESEKFLRQIKYRGMGCIEYIETHGGYKFVEINPRPFFWYSLATSCGVNLYRSMYDHLCGKEINKSDYAQNSKPKIWYHLDYLVQFLRYGQKTIAIIDFLCAPRMEAIANRRDVKLSAKRICKVFKEMLSQYVIARLRKMKSLVATMNCVGRRLHVRKSD